MMKNRSSASKQRSPWLNPRDVMRRTLQRKNHLKKNGLSRQLSLDPDVNPATSFSQPAFSDSDRKFLEPKSRKNPFKRSPKKKKKPGKSIESAENFVPEPEPASNLYSALEHQDRDAESLIGVPTDFSVLRLEESRQSEPLFPQNFTPQNFFAKKDPSPKSLKTWKSSKVAPLDLRLATRLRIVSPEPFPWMELSGTRNSFVMKPSEKTFGTQLFVENRILQSEPSENVNVTSFVKSQLYGATMYFCHPDLPWLQTFPRLEDGKKTASTSVTSLGGKIQAAIFAAWSKSFENLYQSLKAGYCSSFYVCCPTFTVLFLNTKTSKPEDLNGSTSSDSNGSDASGQRTDGLKAIVSVTSSAIRQALREEGIKFSLPYRPGSRRGSTETVGSGTQNTSSGDSSLGSGKSLLFDQSNTQSQPPFLNFSSKSMTHSQSCSDFDGMETEDGNDDDEGLDSSGGSEDQEAWMKDIGISPGQVQKFKKRLSSDKLPQQPHSAKEERMKCVALISETLEVHCLYNFVLNSTLCRAPAGPQAGLPPTLISRRPFQGGVLKNLQIKCGCQKRDNQEQYFLDLSGGPILPESVHVISSLLDKDANRFTVTTPGKDGYLGMNLLGENCAEVDVQTAAFDGTILGEFEELKYEFGIYRF